MRCCVHIVKRLTLCTIEVGNKFFQIKSGIFSESLAALSSVFLALFNRPYTRDYISWTLFRMSFPLAERKPLRSMSQAWFGEGKEFLLVRRTKIEEAQARFQCSNYFMFIFWRHLIIKFFFRHQNHSDNFCLFVMTESCEIWFLKVVIHRSNNVEAVSGRSQKSSKIDNFQSGITFAFKDSLILYWIVYLTRSASSVQWFSTRLHEIFFYFE